jgi:hypothetical protein
MDVIYDGRGMRRPPQDRGGTCGAVAPGARRGGKLFGVIAALVLLGLALAAPASAQRGCAGKPGDPDRAALLQYCPYEAKPSGGSPAGTAAGVTGSGAAAGPSPETKLASEGSGSDEAELPFSDYPSTAGINVLLLLLAALVLALAAAYGVRRWRRTHPPSS